MGALVFIAFAGGLAAFVLYFSSKFEKSVDQAWAKTGEALGVAFKPVKWGEQRSLDGKAGDCSFEVAEVAKGRGRRTRFAVTSRSIPRGLALETEGGVAALGRVLRGEDLRIRGGFFDKKDFEFGDRAFDTVVKVAGPEDTARAALGPKAREAVRALMEMEPSVKLEDGALVLEKAAQLDQVSKILPTVQAMLRAAAELRVTGVPEGLARNVREDAAALARLRDLEMLVLHHAGHPSALEAGRAALADSDAEVRLAAARALGGDEEREAIDQMLRKPEELPNEVAVAALKRMMEIAEYQQVQPRVAQLLQSTAPRVLCAAMILAAHGRDQTTTTRLCELTESTILEIAKTAATALGELGDLRGQPALLKMLGHEDGDVRHAAVAALGKIGDIRAVEPLLPLADGVLPGALRDAAKEAVRRIQSRLGEAGAGRLSVAQVDEAAAAGLSVVEPIKEKA